MLQRKKLTVKVCTTNLSWWPTAVGRAAILFDACSSIVQRKMVWRNVIASWRWSGVRIQIRQRFECIIFLLQIRKATLTSSTHIFEVICHAHVVIGSRQSEAATWRSASNRLVYWRVYNENWIRSRIMRAMGWQVVQDYMGVSPNRAHRMKQNKLVVSESTNLSKRGTLDGFLKKSDRPTASKKARKSHDSDNSSNDLSTSFT